MKQEDPPLGASEQYQLPNVISKDVPDMTDPIAPSTRGQQLPLTPRNGDVNADGNVDGNSDGVDGKPVASPPVAAAQETDDNAASVTSSSSVTFTPETSDTSVEAPDEPEPKAMSSGRSRRKKAATTTKAKAEADAAVESDDSEGYKSEFGNLPYSSLMPSLESRKTNSERRSKQAMLYTRLTEDRLSFLEGEIERLQKLVTSNPPAAGATTTTTESDPAAAAANTSSTSDPEKPAEEGDSATKSSESLDIPTPVLAIKRMNWEEFRTIRLSDIRESEEKLQLGSAGPDDADNVPKKKKTKAKYVLEVLVEEPPSRLKRRVKTSLKRHIIPLGSDKPCPKPSSVGKTGSSGGEVHCPERLRIRSKVLIETLEDVSGLKMPNNDKEELIFLRPFKLFFHFEDKLRTRLKELEDEHEKSLVAAAEAESEDAKQKGSKTDEDTAQTADGKDGKDGETGKETPVKDEEPTAKQEKSNKETALEHLRLLVEFIDNDLEPTLKLRRKIQERTLERIAFSDLWHLFQPGQEVRTSDSRLRLYRISKFTGGREILDLGGSIEGTVVSTLDPKLAGAFVVDAFSFDFDGTQYGPVGEHFAIRRYEGEKHITALPIYPLAFDRDPEATRDRLLSRGSTFASFSRPADTAHKYYSGLTLDEQQEEIDSQIIIDFKLAFEKKPALKPTLGMAANFDHDARETSGRFPGSCTEGCCGTETVMKDYEVDELVYTRFKEEYKDALDPVEDPDELSDDEKVLMPYMVYGFVLRSRKWSTFDLGMVRDVDYKNSWSDLVLPGGHKETVLALVQNHARGPKEDSRKKERSMGLVRGKGKGLIILLHGEPGVGKTSTAECIADHTKRPLFAITCGDIGDNATQVEENLENNFQLAHKWGCVLLIDEADVFLAKRDKKDLTRNAIVSVFLRTLEYYSGILFLTTNRVGAVDKAFKSRIHISLLYPRLDKDATLKIWKNHLTRVQKEYKKTGHSIEVAKKDIISFAKAHYIELKKAGSGTWNGRQIHNAFQTAIALAEYEAGASGTPSLGPSQFKKVAESSKEFDLYLKQVHGGQTDADIAYLDQARLDQYVPGMGGAVGPPHTQRATKLQVATGTGSGRKGRATSRKEEVDSEDVDSEDEDSDDGDSEDDSDESDGDSSDEPPPTPSVQEVRRTTSDRKAKKPSRSLR